MAQDGAGYDADFLAVPVGMPRPLGAHRFTTLPYLRFSVILDTDRRLAAATGVNIDGATLQDLPRTGDWDLDPRVPAAEQAGPAVYADNDFDRGHLVRRRDPGWGTAAEARAATEATFVYTNAAPQASVFNQSKDLWVGLEDHVLQFADATDQRVSVFTGPVLDAADPPYRGIRIPRRFWKVAAWVEACDDGRAHARGRGLRAGSERADRRERDRRRGRPGWARSARSRRRSPTSRRWPASISGRWSPPTSCSSVPHAPARGPS